MDVKLTKVYDSKRCLETCLHSNAIQNGVFVLDRQNSAWFFFLKNIVLFLLFSFNSPLLLPFFFLLVLSVSIFSYPISPLAFPFFLPLPLFSLVSLSPASLSLSLTHRSLSIYFLSSLLYPILRRIVGHIKADSKNLHLILHFDNFCKISSSRKRDQFRNSINIFLFRLNGCW